MVPLRDGVRLATDIYVPPGSGTWPCAMMRTAYGRETPGLDGYARSVSNAGIRTVFVVQDMRGDGASEGAGTFDPFNSENEIPDGYDAVEWCATQSWCNGRVGLFGGSGHSMPAAMAYLGKPPHLVVVYPNNTAANTLTAWAFENRGRRWGYRWLANRGASITEWPKPTTSDYDLTHWQAILSNAAVSNTTVYLGNDRWWNFFHNGNFELAAMMTGRTRFYMSVSPRTHGGLWGGIEKDTSRGTLLTQPDFFQVLAGTVVATSSWVNYTHCGDFPASLSNEWRVARRWPPPSAPVPLYLHQDGTASFSVPASPTAYVAFSYHPTNPAPSIGGAYGYDVTNGCLDQQALTSRADVLYFVTAPMVAPLEIIGAPRVKLYFSTDVPDSLFVVKLVDIYTNGVQGIFTESACMARYWQGLDGAPAPVPSGSVRCLEFDLKTMALTLLPGHRIGVLVTSSSNPAFDVHPNSYTQVWSYAASPTAHHQIHTTATAPSHLILPLAAVPESTVPAVILSAILYNRQARRRAAAARQ
jgi:predicted acyl esterase